MSTMAWMNLTMLVVYTIFLICLIADNEWRD